MKDRLEFQKSIQINGIEGNAGLDEWLYGILPPVLVPLKRNSPFIVTSDHESTKIGEFQTGDCYQDYQTRILPIHIGDFRQTNQKSVCVEACIGYRYAGVQLRHQCYCGFDLPDRSHYRSNDCNMQCPGDSSQKCGDSWRMNIYFTGSLRVILGLETVKILF